MLTNSQRRRVIDRLNDDLAETVQQWALNDYDSLVRFVSDAQGLDKLDDDTLESMFESSFGEPFNEIEELDAE